ncbi:MAG: M24 family metallopeptidase [Candidatus Aminicenantes bacterium]|nr:M24 family metallopeptidase [Candidatus Aminicenantes bacterium]
MNALLADAIVERQAPLVDRGKSVTAAEYRRRWAAVRKAMADRGYDLLYVCGSELDRSDAAWLAGINDPIIERYGVIVPRTGPPVALAGSEGGHVIEDCTRASGVRVALLREFQISDEDYRFARFGTIEDLVASLVPAKPGRPIRLAVASSGQFVPHDHILMLQGRFGSDNVIFDTDLLRRIKYEKSPLELTLIGTAASIADAAFLGMLAAIRPGIAELDVAAVGDYIMKRLGAGRTGFPTIVSSGPRGRSVIGPATNRTIRDGEFVSLGLSPTFQGYHGVMRRTVKAGGERTFAEDQFLAALRGLYHAVMKATIQAAWKGLPSRSIDAAGKAYLENTRLKDVRGRFRTPREPYTFIHNTGCSECQEGFGAVTPYTREPLGDAVALMIDVAFMGFDEKKRLVFPIEYAVIEDGFWRAGREVGVYNRMPLDVQSLVGGDAVEIPAAAVNPYHRPWARSEGCPIRS